MKFRFAAVALSAACVLAACGGTSDSVDGNCDSDNPVRIGAVLELTGAVAEVSQQQLQGAEMAVKELNADQGILGRCVELVSKDSENDPTKAASATRELIDREEVDALIGPVNSGPQGASIEVSKETDTFHVIGALADIDYTNYPFVFRGEFASRQTAPGFIDVAKELGKQNIGILASNDPFGTSVADSVKAAAPSQGVAITRTEFFDPQSVELLPQVRAVKDSGADIVVVVATGQTGISILNARQELGWDAPVLGFSGIATPEIQEGVGDEGMSDVYVTLNYKNLVRDPGADAPSNENVVGFIERLKDFRSEDPLTLNIQWPTGGYDMVMLIADLAERADSLESEALRTELYANGHDGIKSRYEAKDGDHDMIPDDQLTFVVAGTLQDGTLERVPTE